MTNPTPSGGTPRVAVVGAGLAGLHAAWRIHQAGLDVLVLEARDRVGGRTWSHTLEDGTVVERGGEFISPQDSCLRDLCRELDLDLIPHGFSFDRRCAPGEEVPTEEQLASFVEKAGARVAAQGYDVPGDAVVPAPADRTPLEETILRRFATSLTVPLAEVSARAMFGGTYHSYDPADRVRGGNDSVARELARRLGDRVVRESPVRGVEEDADGHGVTLHLHDGTQVTAAAVVLAVPLPVLLTMDVRLPEQVVEAARRLRFGNAAKLHVPLADAADPGGVASPEGLWWCWVSTAADGGGGAPVLSGFAGGAETIEQQSLVTEPEQWAATALSLRPELVGAGQPLITHWADQEWTRGSYSEAGVGTTPADEAAWARAWGSVVFAGEHTAGHAQGTMNGAALSGQRAAQVVIDLFA